ncbi:hypothetical protein EDB85DRAFT_1911518 [Lactarius pseudohatsudake]|nr:hypothetical protein EDB85DRAFT_1911518 [Lactarius pseudohatsudake]
MSQHPPAVRVGGRRLSLPTRVRASNQVDEAVAASPGEPADYPRPTAPGPGIEPNPEHAHNDEEAPPKVRRKSHGAHENERRLRENPQRKAEENWQHREQGGAPRINARISQPGGKVTI